VSELNVKGKRVLVTGGCGFIGTNLTKELLARGAEVAVLDLPAASWDRLPRGVRAIEADITDRESLAGKLGGFQLVYHLAARTDLDGKRLEDYEVNYTGTANLLEEAASNGTLERFVFFSTQLVVGLFNETRFIDESEPYRTKTPYGRSKIEGEKVVIAASREAGVDYTIIRPTSVYGPWGGEPYKDFFRAIRNRRYAHIGRAGNLVSWAYVGNVVDLTILASMSDLAKNETFFASDLHPYTMREIVDTVASHYGARVRTVPSVVATVVAYLLGVAKVVGVDVPLYPFRLRNIKMNYCYDIGRSLRIGHVPATGLREGVRKTLDWYEENGQFA